MKKTIILFTFITFFSKVLAFGRELVLSYHFGASKISDVFLLSMTLPVTIFGFVAAGVTSGYIPVFQKVKKEKGEDCALRFTNNVVNCFVCLCLLMVFTYYLFSGQLLRLFASGFDHDTLRCAKLFTDISIWSILCTAIVTVFTGYLQINGRIQLTALVSVPLNGCVVIAILAAAATGEYRILPVGYLLSCVVQACFLVFYSCRAGFSYQFTLDVKDPYLKQFFSGLSMLVLSGSLQQINTLIDRTLATAVAVGGLSLYEYGSKVNDFVVGLTVIPISTAMFPMMVKARGHMRTLENTLMEGVRISLFVMIPATVILTVYSKAIVTVIYSRGAFGPGETAIAADIVKYYGVGLLAFSVRDMFLKCFYALGDSRTPAVNASVGVVCNIILNFVLQKIMGLGGLALATSISAYISVVLLSVSLLRKMEGMNLKLLLYQSSLLFFISGAACYGSFVIFRRLVKVFGAVFFPFVASMACFAAVYVVLAVGVGIVKKSDFTGLVL